MINIFLNYIKKNNKFSNNNNNVNINNFDSFIKKKKIKNKIYKINNDYIKQCNIINKKQKERIQKLRERYLEVVSTDEEDSYEKKKNHNTNAKPLKKNNKSSEKYISPHKKYHEDETEYEYSNRFHKYNNKKIINNRKIINLYNNNFPIRNSLYSNLKEKKRSIHLLSMTNNKEKKENVNYNKKITSNKNINSIKFYNINKNKNTINTGKSKSISKFFVNKNSPNEEINNQNEIINEKEYKENTPEKSNRLSIYKSSKANRYQIKPNLPYVSNLASQFNNNTSKKYNNNYMEKYNITPVVLPFIGVKQDEKKNKMI
jgi:hypothetical protein